MSSLPVAVAKTKMVHSKESAAAFNGVFTATSNEELARAYDGWAATYDGTVADELSGDGTNRVTLNTVAALAEHVPAATADVRRVLDCGAGTGAAGPLLAAAYGPLDALVAFDLSAGMLARAAARGCYTACVEGCCPDLGAAAAVCAEGFDVCFCAGTFTPNHAPASTLAALAAVTRPGGHVAFSVRTYYYEDPQSGFKAAAAALEAAGRWRAVAADERAYLPAEGVTALYFVYEVLAPPPAAEGRNL